MQNRIAKERMTAAIERPHNEERRSQRSKAALLFVILCIVTPLYGGDGQIRKSKHAIKGEYLVVFRSDLPKGQVPGLARALAGDHGAAPEKIWTDALSGFFVKMPEARAKALARHPLVDFVEENAQTFTSAVTMPTNRDPATCALPEEQGCVETSDNRLWHLDRIDQDSAVASETFSYCGTTPDVYVYVVDSGVQKNHTEFLDAQGNSRVKQVSFNPSGDPFPADIPCGGWVEPVGPGTPASPAGKTDPHNHTGELSTGHGTGTASMVAGKKSGLAKDAFIVPVKVIRCDGYKTRYRQPSIQGQPPRYYAQGSWVHDVFMSGTWKQHKRWRAVQGGYASTEVARDWEPDANGEYHEPVSGGAVWKEYTDVPATEAEYQTAQMLIDGLNSIVSHRNTLPANARAVVTLSVYEQIDTTGVADDPAQPGAQTVQKAIHGIIAAGIPVVASANNQNSDACLTAPAAFSATNLNPSRREGVITVAGSMILNDPEQVGTYDPTKPTRDGRWICPGCNPEPGSNAGPCVSVFAPAKEIAVASTLSATSYRARSGNSGTSWSAPLVAGIVATYLQANPSLSPLAVYNMLRANASTGVLDPASLDTATVPAGSTSNYLVRLGNARITNHPQDSSSTASSPASLSVTVEGTGPFTYQWFQVNNQIVDTARRGAANSIPLAEYGPTLSRHPQSRTGYWVRVTGCGSADSDIAYVTPTTAPTIPTGLVAATNPDRTVTVSWTSTTADAYVVERKVGTANWEDLIVVTSTSHIDSTIPIGATALYRVRSRMNGPPQIDSAPSNVDFAHGWVLTDPAVEQFVTPVRALHITQLRTILNQLTDTALLARRYTDAEALEAALKNQMVDDFHFTDLMAKINAVRGELQLAPVAFGTSLTLIRASHINDLRNGLK